MWWKVQNKKFICGPCLDVPPQEVVFPPNLLFVFLMVKYQDRINPLLLLLLTITFCYFLYSQCLLFSFSFVVVFMFGFSKKRKRLLLWGRSQRCTKLFFEIQYMPFNNHPRSSLSTHASTCHNSLSFDFNPITDLVKIPSLAHDFLHHFFPC